MQALSPLPVVHVEPSSALSKGVCTCTTQSFTHVVKDKHPLGPPDLRCCTTTPPTGTGTAVLCKSIRVCSLTTRGAEGTQGGGEPGSAPRSTHTPRPSYQITPFRSLPFAGETQSPGRGRAVTDQGAEVAGQSAPQVASTEVPPGNPADVAEHLGLQELGNVQPDVPGYRGPVHA